MPKTKSINLLPQEEFEASTLGRVLKWAMSTFRVIVIITEMIVMAAFLSRFWLDARNSDLNDAISIKSAQIEAQMDFENRFRNIQKRLSIFKTLDQLPKSSMIIELLASDIPQNIILSSISIQGASAQVKGSSNSELEISQFISNLQANSAVKDVNLGQVTSSEENPSLLVFTFDISF